MAKKKHRRRKKKRIAFICYVMVLAALTGAIGYLYKINQTKKAEHAVYKQQLMEEEALEGEPDFDMRWMERENSSENE